MDAQAEILYGLRQRVVPAVPSRVDAHCCAYQSAFDTQISCQQCGLEYAGVPAGIFLQGGHANGSRQPVQSVVSSSEKQVISERLSGSRQVKREPLTFVVPCLAQ